MSRPHQTMQLEAEATDEGHIRLLSPEVGGFTGALPEGSTLSPGMVAGTLQVLGRSVDLVVPAGAGGAVVSAAPKLRVAPVGFGDELNLVLSFGAQRAILDLGLAHKASLK